MLRDGVQGVPEDGANVVEAYLEEDLGPNAFYLQFDLVQPGVHAYLQADQARKLRKDGDVRPEVPDRQLDPVYLELRDVQEHVDVLAGWSLFRNAVVGRCCILVHEMWCLPCIEGMMLHSAAPRQLRRIILLRRWVNKGMRRG